MQAKNLEDANEALELLQVTPTADSTLMIWSKAGNCDVRTLILTGPGLDYKEDNSRQGKSDSMEFHISARRPR